MLPGPQSGPGRRGWAGPAGEFSGRDGSYSPGISPARAEGERMLSGTGHDSNASHELTAERMISGTPADVFDGFLSLYGPGRPDWVLESELDLRLRVTRPGSG